MFSLWKSGRNFLTCWKSSEHLAIHPGRHWRDFLAWLCGPHSFGLRCVPGFTICIEIYIRFQPVNFLSTQDAGMRCVLAFRMIRFSSGNHHSLQSQFKAISFKFVISQFRQRLIFSSVHYLINGFGFAFVTPIPQKENYPHPLSVSSKCISNG